MDVFVILTPIFLFGIVTLLALSAATRSLGSIWR
jgi:hypothetical protein